MKSTMHIVTVYISVIVTMMMVLPHGVNGKNLLGATQAPFMLAFSNPQANLSASCARHFWDIRDAIYNDYLDDLLDTSNLTQSTVDLIPPSWNTTFTTADNNLPRYTKYKNQNWNNPNWNNQGWGNQGWNKYNQRMLQSKKTCGPICKDNLILAMLYGCCDICTGCRRRLEESEKTNERQLWNYISVSVVKSTDGKLIINNYGNQMKSNNNIGKRTADLFYQAVNDFIPDSDPCKAILSASTYQVLPMKVWSS